MIFEANVNLYVSNLYHCVSVNVFLCRFFLNKLFVNSFFFVDLQKII